MTSAEGWPGWSGSLSSPREFREGPRPQSGSWNLHPQGGQWGSNTQARRGITATSAGRKGSRPALLFLRAAVLFL